MLYLHDKLVIHLFRGDLCIVTTIRDLPDVLYSKNRAHEEGSCNRNFCIFIGSVVACRFHYIVTYMSPDVNPHKIFQMTAGCKLVSFARADISVQIEPLSTFIADVTMSLRMSR